MESFRPALDKTRLKGELAEFQDTGVLLTGEVDERSNRLGDIARKLARLQGPRGLWELSEGFRQIGFLSADVMNWLTNFATSKFGRLTAEVQAAFATIVALSILKKLLDVNSPGFEGLRYCDQLNSGFSREKIESAIDALRALYTQLNLGSEIEIAVENSLVF